MVRTDLAFIPSLFKGVFTGVESQRKKSLPLGDLNRLMTVPVKGEKLRKTQLALCLMFQYGGMSFVDFAHLNRGNIKNGILDYNRQKTGTSMRLEVLDTAEAMYKELAGEAFPDTKRCSMRPVLWSTLTMPSGTSFVVCR